MPVELMVNVIGNPVCVACGTVLPGGARFCVGCGQPQAGRDSRMRAAHLVGERKLITVLFADVVDSTGLAERMDPEDWAAVMNCAFERLSPVIARYGGTIARLMSDGLLAFFGAPVVHEDDPLRAVEAARELLTTARGYSSEVEPVMGRAFALRVGINTGWVVLGDVGTDLKFEYTAMGDVVNVAARMQAAARPMTALLTAQTYQQVADRTVCRDRGLVPIRGRSQAVRAFELTPSPMPEAAPAARPTPGPAFVGREAELDALSRHLAALAVGQGGLLQVVGEAGSGKTRLLAEARRRHEPLAVQWLQSQATQSEPGRAVPFAPFRAMVGAACGRSRSGQGTPGLDEPDIALRIIRLVERLIDRQPVMLVLDDVQGLDPASIGVLRSLARLAARRPLLICVLGRPEATTLPARFAAGDQLGVSALARADSARLVDAMLTAGGVVWPGLAELVYATAEGNPLFTERIVHAALARGRADQRAASECLPVPSVVQQLVAARLDRLDPDVREMLRVVAVVGRRVGERLLRQIAGCPERIDGYLGVLEELNFLRRETVGGEPTYRFTHELDWQLANASVLARQRQELLGLVRAALLHGPDRLAAPPAGPDRARTLAAA